MRHLACLARDPASAVLQSGRALHVLSGVTLGIMPLDFAAAAAASFLQTCASWRPTHWSFSAPLCRPTCCVASLHCSRFPCGAASSVGGQATAAFRVTAAPSTAGSLHGRKPVSSPVQPNIARTGH